MARTDAERWDRWAPRYDRWRRARRLRLPLYEKILEALAPRPGERMLDVGAGTGTVVARAAAGGALAFGVDPSVGMVRVAHGKAAGRFAAAEAESLPFADATFDVAMTSMSMHHWHAPRRGVAQLGRVLRPGGRVLLADLEGRGPWRRISNAFHRLRRRHHMRYLSRAEVAGMLGEAGFVALGAETFRGGVLLAFGEMTR